MSREQRQDDLPEVYRERAMQTPYKFELGGFSYACHGLLPLEEIHLARRLAPIVLSALKPEGGRSVIVGQLLKIAALAGEDRGPGSPTPVQGEIVSNAIELAISVLEAASATSEEAIDEIIRRVMKKINREVGSEGERGIVPVWDGKWNVPAKRDIDGFTVIALIARYIVMAFQDRILEYVTTLASNDAVKATSGKARPPFAPAARG